MFAKSNFNLFPDDVKSKTPLVTEEVPKFVTELSGPLIVLFVSTAVSSCKTTVL